MAKKTTKTTVKKAAENTVYIGNPLRGLAQYTVFIGGVLPPHVEAMAAADETIKGLIVPASKLQEARQNINRKGHILNYYMQKQTKNKEN